MKYIITENQLYNLIPSEIKRRINIGDMEIIDKLIKRHYRAKGNWFHSDTFEDYLNTVVLGVISTFIHDHKDMDVDDDNWFRNRNELVQIYQGLVPYLKKKYYNEMKKYYKTMKS